MNNGSGSNGAVTIGDVIARTRAQLGIDGWTPTLPLAEADGRTEDLAAMARVETLERSIPPHYDWARFEAPDLAARVRRKAVLAEAQAAYRNADVLLFGGSHRGKTSLAVAMLRARAKALPNEPMLFLRAHRLGQSRIQHPAGHGEAPDVLEAMRVKMVLLDGLGEEKDTLSSPIADIVFERYEQNLATWVTTGLRGKDLVARYGAGIARRLWEQPRVTILRLDDPKPDRTKK